MGSGVIGLRGDDFTGAVKNMSPSHVEGVDITIKSDFFSLGVLGYLLLTGDYPFAAPTPGQTADKIRERTYRPIGEKAGSGVLSDIIERCIKQIEGTEFQSLREIASALAGYLKNLDEDEPTSSPEDTETTHDDDPDATMAFQVPDELQAFLDQHDAYLDDGESQASLSVEAEQPEDTMNRPIGTLDTEDDLQQPFFTDEVNDDFVATNPSVDNALLGTDPVVQPGQEIDDDLPFHSVSISQSVIEEEASQLDSVDTVKHDDEQTECLPHPSSISTIFCRRMMTR